jgi:transposase
VDDVMISVDPHKASKTAAVLDPATKTVIASERFANTRAGYQQLRGFGDRWQQRRWAVEGCHGAGRLLAQRLVADGEVVLDVPAKLAARVRVYSQGHGRKTDVDDAVAIGLAALNSDGVTTVRADDLLVSLRLLCDRRDELAALRTQAVCRIHRLLAELTPGGTHRGLRASRAEQLLAKLRPAGAVDAVRLQLAHQHLEDIRALDAKMKTVREQIAALVEQTNTRLTDLYGIGPLIAGRILAEVSGIARFPSRHHFASYNGTAPIDASSGDQVRHRLPSRQPATQPRVAHDGRDPDPAARQRGSRLLRAQTPRGQDSERSAAVPEAPPIRPRLPTNARRPRPPARSHSGHNRRVRISYNRDADAAYIRLGEATPSTHRATTRAALPEAVNGFVALDWEDDQLVGIEILDASVRLPHDVLEQAEQLS